MLEINEQEQEAGRECLVKTADFSRDKDQVNTSKLITDGWKRSDRAVFIDCQVIYALETS